MYQQTFWRDGSVGAVKYHIQAAKDRDEAASLRDQLAQLENQAPLPRGRAFRDAHFSQVRSFVLSR